MSDAERYGNRDLTYSNWHRKAWVRRFVGDQAAHEMTMIDLDGIEYCCRCFEAVGVIETARDVGQSYKPVRVTKQLALRLGVPGLLTLYRPSETDRIGDYPDIEGFRVRQIAPTWTDERSLTPTQYAHWLKRMHDRCPCRLQEQIAA